MDGSHSNDGQDSSSSCGMADPRSYDVIPSWEEIFDAPIIHPQQEYQNMQSSQFGDFFQQKRMWVQDSAENQLRFQHSQNQLQHQKVQSTQYRALRRPRQLLPNMVQDCFENQRSPQHMQSVQFSALQQQNTMPSTMQVLETSHNQGEVPQDPVNQQQYQLQTNQQQLQPHGSLYNFPSPPPHTSMSMHSPPPFIIRSPEKPRKSVAHKPMDPNPDQITEEEMKEFVKIMYMRRRLLGISQDALRLELSKLSLKEVTQQDFSRFERLQLRFKTMCYFKRLLEDWLEKLETSVRESYSSVDAPESTIQHLKKEISISLNKQHGLEEAFKKNSNPRLDEIQKLAKSLNMVPLAVTIWFYDKRQILKRYKSQTTCPISHSPLPITSSYFQLIQAGRQANPT